MSSAREGRRRRPSPSTVLVVATIGLLSWMAWSVGETLGEQRDLIRELRLELREPGVVADDPEGEDVPPRDDVFRAVPLILDRLDDIECRLDRLDDDSGDE